MESLKLTEKRTLLHELKLELSKFDNGDVVTPLILCTVPDVLEVHVVP